MMHLIKESQTQFTTIVEQMVRMGRMGQILVGQADRRAKGVKVVKVNEVRINNFIYL